MERLSNVVFLTISTPTLIGFFTFNSEQFEAYRPIKQNNTLKKKQKKTPSESKKFLPSLNKK